MNDEGTDNHLSGISTMWTVVRDAHCGNEIDEIAAQARLLRRYRGAILRYVDAFIRDRDSAEDICQDFAVRFVRGDFKNADPARGRFRDLVKTSVYHLMIDFIRRREAQPKPMSDSGLKTPSVPPAEFESDLEFIRRWRAELLNRTWEALRDSQPNGAKFYETLFQRVTHPGADSTQLAAVLSDKLRQPITAALSRQWLHRARERFAELLIEEVARSLGDADRNRVEQELIDLDLLPYCKPALNRRDEQVAAAE